MTLKRDVGLDRTPIISIIINLIEVIQTKQFW